MNKHIYIDTKIDDLVVSIHPRELNSKLPATILHKVSQKYGNKCYKDVGYILKNSISILKNNLIKISGSTSTALMTCNVTIKCTVCCPHNDAIVKCHIIDKIENAYLAYFGPLVIFIRRSKEDDYDLQVRQIVNVEIKMVRLNDSSINVFANYVSKSDELNYYEIPETSSSIVMIDTVKYTNNIDEYTYLEDAGYTISLNEKKQEIKKVGNWRLIRDLINPYEIISPSPYYNDTIVDKEAFYSSINALGKQEIIISSMINRAYFKMWEILHDKKEDKWGNLLQSYANQDIVVLGIAEAPGGFMQAIMDSRIKQTDNEFKDIYRAISLKDDEIQWNNEVLSKYREKFDLDLMYDYGTNDGDIRTIEEQQYIKENLLQNKKAHLIVADGGIDVSKDYYSQEVQNHKLFYSEIVIALSNQEVGGNFVMKCYDLYTVLSVQYLTILKNYYNNVYIIKPELSRPANSEKYIVALGYNGKFSSSMATRSSDMISRWENDKYILELLTSVDNTIMGSMKFINDYFSNRQMSFIQAGISAAEGDKFKIPKSQQDYKAVQLKASSKWCEDYGIPTRNISLKINKYLSS